MKEALLYERLEQNKVKCNLCCHRCVVAPGKRGLCGVRENRDGTLYSLVYGKVVAKNIDPIEKKPLFHFHPGSRSYSIATVGCNFRCLHCQNWQISQYPGLTDGEIEGENATPEQIVQEAVSTGCLSISYTYTEPTIFFEFAYDTAVLAHDKGVKNVFVSNGYMTPEARQMLYPYLDGINIDLKGDENFYKKICGAKLQPVLESIRDFREKGVWVEVTTLIIPGLNDSEEFIEEVAEFILSIDPGIPLHITQFYPTYRLTDRQRTPVQTLRKARKICLEKGLRFVYEGNVPGEGGENTYCPVCGTLLIGRVGFWLAEININSGRCKKCGERIEGVGMP